MIEPLYLSRDRRGLLVAIAAGHLYRSLGGMLLWRRRPGANNVRIAKRRIAEFVAAGWVRELDDAQRPVELTAAGEAVLDGAR